MFVEKQFRIENNEKNIVILTRRLNVTHVLPIEYINKKKTTNGNRNETAINKKYNFHKTQQVDEKANSLRGRYLRVPVNLLGTQFKLSCSAANEELCDPLYPCHESLMYSAANISLPVGKSGIMLIYTI